MERAAVALLCLVVLVLMVLFAAGWWEGNRADRLEARVGIINAEAARDREANLHREFMFQAWTVALAAFGQSSQVPLAVVAALLGAGAGAVVILWWERRAGSS